MPSPVHPLAVKGQMPVESLGTSPSGRDPPGASVATRESCLLRGQLAPCDLAPPATPASPSFHLNSQAVPRHLMPSVLRSAWRTISLPCLSPELQFVLLHLFLGSPGHDDSPPLPALGPTRVSTHLTVDMSVYLSISHTCDNYSETQRNQ